MAIAPPITLRSTAGEVRVGYRVITDLLACGRGRLRLGGEVPDEVPGEEEGRRDVVPGQRGEDAPHAVGVRARVEGQRRYLGMGRDGRPVLAAQCGGTGWVAAEAAGSGPDTARAPAAINTAAANGPTRDDCLVNRPMTLPALAAALASKRGVG